MKAKDEFVAITGGAEAVPHDVLGPDLLGELGREPGLADPRASDYDNAMEGPHHFSHRSFPT